MLLFKICIARFVEIVIILVIGGIYGIALIVYVLALGVGSY